MRKYTSKELEAMSIDKVEEYYKQLHAAHAKSE